MAAADAPGVLSLNVMFRQCRGLFDTPAGQMGGAAQAVAAAWRQLMSPVCYDSFHTCVQDAGFL